MNELFRVLLEKAVNTLLKTELTAFLDYKNLIEAINCNNYNLGKFPVGGIKMNINDEKYGKSPFVVNIEDATVQNDTYRTTIWTGEKLQATVMSIPPNDDIGLEVHHGIDQFIRIEEGNGLCKMGPTKDDLNFEKEVKDDDAVFVPANMWHNIVNIGDKPLKLYTIYAGPDHIPGTVHKTHDDARNDPNEQD